MAYPVGSPRGHLRDKPQQEEKIELGGNWKKGTDLTETVEIY